MFPEAYTIGQNHSLHRLTEFEVDFDTPLMNGLIVWEEPKTAVDYTIGVDVSWGVGEDRSALHVLRNGTVHSVDRQVAEFCTDDMSMHDLVPVCYMIGNLYKNTVEDREALMSVECNISDDIVHRLRMDYNYANLFVWKFYDNIKGMMSNKLGWWTNVRTRPKIISKAMHYIKNDWWAINSPWLLNEMQTIEKLEEKARVEAAAGHHDDLFMAAAIALWSAHDMEFGAVQGIEEVAKQRDRLATQVVETRSVSLPALEKRIDFINTACSYNDMESWVYGD
jgi:hypothetical protein